MNTKNKIFFLVISVISFMFILITADMIYNFRDYGLKSIEDKAHALAKTIKHSLTSQMVSGAIDDRALFLSQLKDIPSIDNIWLSRGKKVIDLYGDGLFNEHAKDSIDKEVLKTGKSKKVIEENLFSQSTYRITIPYKATSLGKIDCLSCHSNAKEGDTLGAISIKMSVDDSKNAGIKTVANTIIIAFILTILIIFVLNIIISPFLNLFESIKKVMGKAHQGDYSQRVDLMESKEANDVANWINSFLEKLENTLKSIDVQISNFISKNYKEEKKDPLLNIKNTIQRLLDVYNFRRAIEYDNTLEDVYKRLVQVIKNKTPIEEFNLFESNSKTKDIKIIHQERDIFCNILKEGCRANRTNTIIDSTQFNNICPSCNCNKSGDYFCIPYPISNEIDLIVSIHSKDKTIDIENFFSYVKDYIDVARTVIVSKKLLLILEKNAQTDALTGLFNRKYLEELLPKITSQINRVEIEYGILMIDIDFFKMVNDTYGHDIGDRALKIVSKVLKENIRKSDTAIRYGGEEFMILLYNCNEAHLKDIAQKILVNFSLTDIPVGNKTIRKTLSIGISMYPKDSKSIKEAIKFADLALYKAKNRGRNNVFRFDNSIIDVKNKYK